MTDADIARLESELNLKLPAKFVEYLLKAAAEFVDWPPGSDMNADNLLTDPHRLLRINRKVRQSPADFVQDPQEMAHQWPDHLFVCGVRSKLELWVIDCREETGRIHEVLLTQKKFGPSRSFKDIRDLYQAIRPVYQLAAKGAQKQAKKQAAWRKANPDVESPDLVAVGRAMARPALSLEPKGEDYAAVWLGQGVVDGPEGEWRHRISVDCRQLPVNPRKLTGVLSVYEGTGGQRFADRYVVHHDPQAKLPHKTEGTKLYGAPFECLPPIEVLFKHGSPAVKQWLESQKWTTYDYTAAMPDPEPGRLYLRAWFENHPFYTERGYAMLGGWLIPFPEDDWQDLVDQSLLTMTIRDAEPYVEVWGDGKKLRCVPRVT